MQKPLPLLIRSRRMPPRKPRAKLPPPQNPQPELPQSPRQQPAPLHLQLLQPAQLPQNPRLPAQFPGVPSLASPAESRRHRNLRQLHPARPHLWLQNPRHLAQFQQQANRPQRRPLDQLVACLCISSVRRNLGSVPALRNPCDPAKPALHQAGQLPAAR